MVLPFVQDIVIFLEVFKKSRIQEILRRIQEIRSNLRARTRSCLCTVFFSEPEASRGCQRPWNLAFLLWSSLGLPCGPLDLSSWRHHGRVIKAGPWGRREGSSGSLWCFSVLAKHTGYCREITSKAPCLAKHQSRTLHKHYWCGTKHGSLSSGLLLHLREASSQLLSWLVDMRKLLMGSPSGVLEGQGKQMVVEKASQSPSCQTPWCAPLSCP